MGEQRVIEQFAEAPVTVESLAADLHMLGVRPGMTLLVHTALSALGWVCGGPVAVLLALEQALGPAGTLVMPTFSTGLSEPSKWGNPPVPPSWWDTIRQTMPAYDPVLTPTRKMGAVAECFRSQPGTLRSPHPQLSFAARGPQAERIVGQHALDEPLGDNSPLARIYELDGWVLLLGVGHGNNTSLHLAECRASYPGKHSVQQGAPMLVNGQRAWVGFAMTGPHDADFPDIGADFATATGQERIGPAGAGLARLMPQRALVDYGVGWLPAHRRAE
ncbi:MAG: AAC(3) family N-acetyltransferase [Roseiflexaceae bacterium]